MIFPIKGIKEVIKGSDISIVPLKIIIFLTYKMQAKVQLKR